MKKEPISPDEVKIVSLKHCVRHAIESLKTETGCTTVEVIKFLLVVRPFEIIFPNVKNAEGQDKENKIDNITKYIKLYSRSIKEYCKIETIHYTTGDRTSTFYPELITTDNLIQWFLFNIGRYHSGDQCYLVSRNGIVDDPKGLIPTLIQTFNISN